MRFAFHFCVQNKDIIRTVLLALQQRVLTFVIVSGCVLDFFLLEKWINPKGK